MSVMDVALMVGTIAIIALLVWAYTADYATVWEMLRDGGLPVLPISVILMLVLPRYLGYLLPGIDDTWLGYGFVFGVTFTLAGIYRNRTDGDTGCLYLIVGGGMLVLSSIFVIPYALHIIGR